MTYDRDGDPDMLFFDKAEADFYAGDCAPSPLYTRPIQPLSDEQIKEICLRHGFTVKDGLSSLKPYVYKTCRAVLRAAHDITGDNS